MPNLSADGFAVVDTAVPPALRETLRQSVFTEVAAGKRCLLDHPVVAETACLLRDELVESGHLHRK